jgi:hypothetical protein
MAVGMAETKVIAIGRGNGRYNRSVNQSLELPPLRRLSAGKHEGEGNGVSSPVDPT